MTKKKKNNKQKTLDENRSVFLFDEINEEKAQEVIERLLYLDVVNHKKIKIYICSPGGGVGTTLGIIDTINLIKSKVDTYIVGKAFSGGSIVSMVGNKRYMTKNSYWMAHKLRGNIRTDYPEYVQDHAIYMTKLQETLYSLYRKHTGLTTKDYKKLENGEVWLNAEECLKKGAVDEIV